VKGHRFSRYSNVLQPKGVSLPKFEVPSGSGDSQKLYLSLIGVEDK
jgi:hypothetical protein